VTTVAIGEAVTGGALRTTHFFNGRLLTGEDLGREQDVQAARLRRFGQALGDGVVQGLTVSVTPGSSATRPVVSVSPGLAVSRSGLALELPAETDISIAGESAGPGTEPGALFAQCQPYQPSEYSTGAGVYLLAIGPHSTSEGLASVSGLHNQDALCNTAYEVEGVSFRRLRLAIPLAELDDHDRLRNRVAYRMFAPEDVARLWRDPFGPALTGYGLLDELRPDYLRDDEVPLALIGWEAGAGIRFVDHWSVRRRITRRGAPDRFGPLAGDRLLAEGEARFLQFQEHVAELRGGSPPPPRVVARNAFEQLPPAGVLQLFTSSNPQGFDLPTFFGGLATAPAVHVEGAAVESLLRESFAYPPIHLASDEAIRVYLVSENARSADRPYAVFASGHLPYRADARFHLAYWDFANYAERH
jgi:hypothetical protein